MSGIMTRQGNNNNLATATGRTAAISVIDCIMGDSENLATFHKKLQEAFDENPLEFFQDFVMPLIPRSHIHMGGEQGVNVNIVMKNADVKQVEARDVDNNLIDLHENNP